MHEELYKTIKDGHMMHHSWEVIYGLSNITTGSSLYTKKCTRTRHNSYSAQNNVSIRKEILKMNLFPRRGNSYPSWISRKLNHIHIHQGFEER